MLIDWFTVGAQVVNFLILVWLLKRFLYRPILDAIDAREKRIAGELADAAARMAEAVAMRDDFDRKSEAFEQQRATLLKQATDAAKTERHRLMDEARQAAEALSAKRMQALNDEVHSLSQAIARRAQQEVFEIARKALAGLASANLEERMVEVFIGRLRDLDGHARENFARALEAASGAALVRSAFDLPPAQQGAVQQALGEIFGQEIHVSFQTAPDLVSGIEVTASGQRVAWSIANYLTSLEKNLDELLKVQSIPEVNAEPELDNSKSATKRQ